MSIYIPTQDGAARGWRSRPGVASEGDLRQGDVNGYPGGAFSLYALVVRDVLIARLLYNSQKVAPKIVDARNKIPSAPQA